MAEKGKIIVLEGLDGAGTTSMSEEIHSFFGTTVNTREPYSVELTPVLRKFISGEHPDPGWRVMSMLFSADRLMHCNDIRLVLESFDVVCDRYLGSTIAYQTAMAPEEEREEARKFISEQLSIGSIEPDLTLFLHVDPQTCADRRGKSREAEDYYERSEFQSRVAEEYEEWFTAAKKSGKGNYVRIDASQHYDVVAAACVEAAAELLGEGKNDVR